MKVKRYIWGGDLGEIEFNLSKEMQRPTFSLVLPSLLFQPVFPTLSLHCLLSVSFPVKVHFLNEVCSSDSVKTQSLPQLSNRPVSLLLYFVPQNRRTSVLLQSLFILFLTYFPTLECELIEDRQCCLYCLLWDPQCLPMAAMGQSLNRFLLNE